jgi:AcrR family transcriptional regulator
VLDAAEHQLSTVGYAATTLRSIAEEVGITSLYHYFPSKSELVTTLLNEAADFTFSRIQHVAEVDAPIVDKLVMLLRAEVAIFDERPELAAFSTRLLGDAMRYKELTAGLRITRRAMNDFYARLLSDDAASGLQADVDQQGLIELFAGLTHGMASLAATSTTRHRAAIERMTELFNDTLINRQPATTP